MTNRQLPPVERFLMRQKYFGVPRWVVGGLLVGIILCVGWLRQQQSVSEQVRAAVEGFRHSSVYVQPGAPSMVNPERVKQVLGDRPIVVAVFDETPLPRRDEGGGAGQQLCGEIADLVPTNIVIAYANDPKRGYGSSFCTGDEFSNADNPVDETNFDFPLIAKAESAWKYRISKTDLTPEVEEFVLAFDAQAAVDYKTTVPRRGAVPDELATSEVVFALGGIVAACVALFFLLHLLARLLGRRTPRNRKRLEMSARLSKIGEYVMSGDPQQPDQAEVSRQYVLALQGFEAGANVENQVKRLEGLMR